MIENKIDYYAYIHSTPNGKPFYVGKGHGRRSRDLNSGRNLHHKNTVHKYGAENIIVREYWCNSEQEAFDLEKMLIRGLRKTKIGIVNITDGGEGASGCVRSAETRLKISDSAKGNTRWLGKHHTEETKLKLAIIRLGSKSSEETKQKISIASKGKSYRKGMRASDETRAKMSKSRTGKVHSKESCDKRSESLKGRIVSEETRKKISESKTGKTYSEEIKKKMSDALIGNSRTKGFVHSAETREKQSLAQIARWEKINRGKK